MVEKLFNQNEQRCHRQQKRNRADYQELQKVLLSIPVTKSRCVSGKPHKLSRWPNLGFLPFPGDILFLAMRKDPIRTGEIVVFNINGREIPIVDRVITVHERQNTGAVEVLTKGDNSYGDDRLLYARGQDWLEREHIMGRAVGFLPYVGWVTIIMTEKSMIKNSKIGSTL